MVARKGESRGGSMKKVVLAVVALVSSVNVAVMAQQKTAGQKEMSVEESFLQESVELMVIREQSRAESRDMKLVALEYIGDAIKAGRTGPEIQKALEYLALEGIVNISREGGMNGRITNNFPDVRAKAAQYLGDLGTPEAKATLKKLLIAENEPMVLVETIKSLSRIKDAGDEDTTAAIAWVVTRFDILNPDNLLALAAVDAYEKIAEANGGLKDPSAIRAIIRIAEGPYIRPVQARAREVLNNLRKYNNQNSGNSSQNSSNSKK